MRLGTAGCSSQSSRSWIDRSQLDLIELVLDKNLERGGYSRRVGVAGEFARWAAKRRGGTSMAHRFSSQYSPPKSQLDREPERGTIAGGGDWRGRRCFMLRDF